MRKTRTKAKKKLKVGREEVLNGEDFPLMKNL